MYRSSQAAHCRQNLSASSPKSGLPRLTKPGIFLPMKKPTGQPFTSETGRAASLKSPWRKQQFCSTKKARAYRAIFDKAGKT